jgi:hypothetical protein
VLHVPWTTSVYLVVHFVLVCIGNEAFYKMHNYDKLLNIWLGALMCTTPMHFVDPNAQLQ